MFNIISNSCFILNYGNHECLVVILSLILTLILLSFNLFSYVLYILYVCLSIHHTPAVQWRIRLFQVCQQLSELVKFLSYQQFGKVVCYHHLCWTLSYLDQSSFNQIFCIEDLNVKISCSVVCTLTVVFFYFYCTLIILVNCVHIHFEPLFFYKSSCLDHFTKLLGNVNDLVLS